MATIQTLKTLVQNALETKAKNAKFYRVTYDENGASVDNDPSKEVKPSSNLSNEVSSVWGLDKLDGRQVAEVRAPWRFEHFLEFPVEVTLEFYEAVMQAGIVLSREEVKAATGGAHDVQIRLGLLSCGVQHPPRGQSQYGTKVKYLVIATLGRSANGAGAC